MLINNDEYLQILKAACDFIYKAQYNAVIGKINNKFNYGLVRDLTSTFL